LYFLFHWLARSPAADMSSLWRSRKELAVLAAERASFMETWEGSFWKLLAVRTADCFSAHVVPPGCVGGGVWVCGGGLMVWGTWLEFELGFEFMRANRDCSSDSWFIAVAG
jgi:hypothetical protein